MKTYEVTVNDDTAAMVEKMLQDGPWDNVDQLFADGLGTLQEDVLIEQEMNLDYDEVRRKLQDAEEDIVAGRVYSEDEVYAYLLDKIKSKRAVAQA